MHKTLLISLLFVTRGVMGQTADSTKGASDTGGVVVVKDPRVDQLVKKQIEINDITTRESRRFVQGYRIQVISSPDRAKVYQAKAKIYEQFPDIQAYLLWQPPNYKLRVGNFKTEEEAEEAQKQLSRLFPSDLYIIQDIIELKLSDVPRADTTNP